MPPFMFDFFLNRLFCDALVYGLEFFFPAVDWRGMAKQVRLSTSEEMATSC
jgi:hypothetical protein